MTFIRSVQWQQISLMERWNERDNSLGRFGTRFGRQAEARGFSGIARAFDTLLDLNERSVAMRQAAAPAWVHERNDRSWRARQAVREPVTQVENDRDVLRVCTIYELRAAPRPPHPAWLGIPHRDELTARLLRLCDMLDSLFPQDALTHEAPARPAPA